MNYQGAKIFLSIVEHQSISAAARALYITQPAVSAQLKTLEDELGVQLLQRQRGRSRITLTQEGTAFIPVAKEWVIAERTLQSYKDTYRQPILRFGAISGRHDHITRQLIEKLEKAFPQLETQQYIIPDTEMALMSKPPHFDVALRVYYYANTTASSQYCIKVPFFQELMLVLCPADTALPERVLTPEDLDPAFELRSAFMSELMILWRQKHFPENAISHFPVVTNALNTHLYFRDSRCWAFVPSTIVEHLIAEYPGQLTYRQISPMLPTRNGNIIVSKSFSRPDILQAFYSCCREYLAERPYLESLLPDNI